MMSNNTKKYNNKGLNVNTVNFIQVNVGKRIAATQNLDETRCRNVVGLIQEPSWVVGQK
jgi:hypothetical protein